MLSESQIEEIKKQLISQIEKNFPDDRREFAVKQIQEMNPEQLEEFLKNNKLIAQGGEKGECIFCSIVAGKIDSVKIAENEDAIAVLEINPVSRGHVLIIPKAHISSNEELPKKVHEFATIISETLKNKLKAKEIKISSSNILGHEILNLIPEYESSKSQQENKRKPATPEELSAIQKKLTGKIKEVEKPKKEKPKPKEKLKLPKRIP